MENKFKYYAFISYNHLDEKWAKRLQYKLHHYRLPTIARKEIGEDVKIRPVFRYVTNLAIGPLKKGIGKELEESKYLIVICSPNSAQPNIKGEHWVNDEVKRFIEMGRGDRIVPVIIGGEPNTGDERECFPPALRKSESSATDEISAANLVQGSRRERRDAFLKIVAKLLDLQPDQLIKLTDREDRQRRIRTWLKFVPLLALTLIGGLFAWDVTRTVKNYYANYVDSFGLPEGIFPLKESDLTHRQVHYRFEYNGFQHGKSPHADSADWCIWNLFGFRRRLVRVVQANSRGYPCKWGHTEYSDRPKVQDFKYDRDLRLCEIRYVRYNGEGNGPHLEKRIELWDEGGVVNGLVKFFAGKGQLGLAYAAASATSRNPMERLGAAKGEITQHLLQRDAKGRVTRRLFLNLSGGNVPDGDGLYGFSYEYDDLGRQTAQWYLFRDGDGFSRCANKKGVAGRKYEYTGRNLRKAEYVDPEGRPTTGPYGWMVCVDSFDEFDNNTESWYFDEKGNKSICTEGYAGCRWEYDAFGNRVRLVLLDIVGQPTLHKDGNAGWIAEYDARGNMTKQMYCGVDGKPTLLKDGYAELRITYDAHGNRTRELYFGVDGKPTLHMDGCAELRMGYDARGNRTRELYFGVDGKPTLCKDGSAGWIAEYDERGRETRNVWIGVDGKPTPTKDGYAEYRKEYDARGNITKQMYFGVDGKPTLHKDGYAEIRWEYDARGNRTRESYFGVDGKPTPIKGGFAALHLEYDERGNITKNSCFGVDGKPTLANVGYAECRTEFDERGNSTKESYFGIDGKPICSYQGFAEMRLEHDGRGNRTKELYFGVDGKPTCSEEGIAEMRVEFDERGNRTRDLYFGVDGRPALCSEGYAEYRWEYDARGNVTREASFDVDGKPTMTSKGYAEVRVEYDAYGNVTDLLCIGIDGKPVLSKDGYAERRQSYDEHGNATRISFWGADGKPILHKSGYSEVHLEYDGRGNKTKVAFFGVDGKPTVSFVDGCAGRHQWYDAQGNMTRVAFFGIDGKPMLQKDGCAEARFTYNSDGTVATFEQFDVNGNAITMRLVVTSKKVNPALMAGKQGVKAGDLWCRLGTYDVLKSKNIYDLSAPLKASINTEKELVVARNEGGEYKILSFKFPVGQMGIEINAQTLSNFDKLEKAYRAYCEKEKGEKK